MAEKWYIIEQFGKVGPFSLQDMLSSVERGDFDYSITIEAENTQQRTTLGDLIAKKKRARRTKKKKRPDADATRITPNENRHRNLEVVATSSAESDFGLKQSARGRRTSNVRVNNSSYVERRHRSSRDSRKPLLLIPAMLAGGVISLALFYGLQKLTADHERGEEASTANIVDLPFESEEFPSSDNYETGRSTDKSSTVLDIRAARRKTNQVVLLGPLTFSKSELYRCRVKCKLEFKDTSGNRITGIFFAQAHKNELLKRTSRVILKGRISVDGKELYLQSISP